MADRGPTGDMDKFTGIEVLSEYSDSDSEQSEMDSWDKWQEERKLAATGATQMPRQPRVLRDEAIIRPGHLPHHKVQRPGSGPEWLHRRPSGWTSWGAQGLSPGSESAGEEGMKDVGPAKDAPDNAALSRAYEE